ncbi:MAG: transcription factor S [Methermicoccaceae archaeon]
MKFCPKCKSIMIPDKNGNMVCRKCGYMEGDEGGPAMVSRVEIEEHEISVLEDDEGVGLPTIKVQCPECGNNLAYWWLRQLRSADESEVRFFRCTKCGKTWREYD